MLRLPDAQHGLLLILFLHFGQFPKESQEAADRIFADDKNYKRECELSMIAFAESTES